MGEFQYQPIPLGIALKVVTVLRIEHDIALSYAQRICIVEAYPQ